MVSYPAEEQIYYVLDGNGVLLYDDQKAPVKKNDFMYLPVGVNHGMANRVRSARARSGDGVSRSRPASK